VAWRGVAWRGVAWRGVAWRGVAWRGVAWRGVVWCGVVWLLSVGSSAGAASVCACGSNILTRVFSHSLLNQARGTPPLRPPPQTKQATHTHTRTRTRTRTKAGGGVDAVHPRVLVRRNGAARAVPAPDAASAAPHTVPRPSRTRPCGGCRLQVFCVWCARVCVSWARAGRFRNRGEHVRAHVPLCIRARVCARMCKCVRVRVHVHVLLCVGPRAHERGNTRRAERSMAAAGNTSKPWHHQQARRAAHATPCVVRLVRGARTHTHT
jgi:hypothetical protein